MNATLPPEVTSFLESGVSVLVGTSDPRLLPEAMRGVGARVEARGAELTVFLPAATAARTLANLRHNGLIAVCFSRPIDHRSLQIKGRVVSIRDGDATDRAAIERYLEALTGTWQEIGVPPAVVRRVARWPAYAIRLRVQDVFVQTPGPGAGAPLAAGEATR